MRRGTVPKSTEYPDLNFVQALSWENANRMSVQFLVMHTTEGSEHRTSAEDGAAYDSWRTDGTSCHYFHDSDSTVQCVRTEDVAYSAFYNGNMKGIHHELCTQAADSVADWADAYHVAMLDRAAKQVARDCAKWDIPPVRLTVAQMQAGKKGICGHGDVSKAYPQDNGDHTDPGKNFPWTGFLNRVKSYMNGDDVAAEQDLITISEDTNEALYGGKLPAGTKRSVANVLQLTGIWTKRGADTGTKLLEEQKKTNDLLAQLVAQGKVPPKA
jgi:N-acetyl-anhydromuramyl-L-alanine amidase AmpD